MRNESGRIAMTIVATRIQGKDISIFFLRGDTSVSISLVGVEACGGKFIDVFPTVISL